MSSSGETSAPASESVSNTPVVAVTHMLSEKTKAVAHPGDKWKSGYLTLARSSEKKSGWRNVHMSKRSFEKLCENLSAITEALRKKTHHHVMLTKKQHVLTTIFKPEGKEALFYVSILHPTSDLTTLTPEDEINHAKTINLSVDEFAKFTCQHQQLLEVVKSKVATPENEESPQLECFRWTHKNTGQRSSAIYLTREECSKSADYHYCHINRDNLQGQPMEYDYESHFEFENVQVTRPGKLEVIEHLAHSSIAKSLSAKGHNVEEQPPQEKDLIHAIEQFDKTAFKVLVRKVLTRLSYKNLYMSSELVGIFEYVGGIDKVKNCLLKHLQPCQGKLFTRLLDNCFAIVHSEMGKEC